MRGIMPYRYPENTAANIDDFRRSGWQAAINPSSGGDDHHSMWHALSEAARIAIENGEISQGKVLWLLADACSMILNPGSANEPFKPMMVTQSGRSSLPEDFQEQDIDLLAQISEEVSNPWLQARLADLAWLLKSPRSPKHALLAIDAYRKIPLEAKTWRQEGQDCWERAIKLSRTLRAGAGERIQEIEASIISAFDAANENDGFFALGLSDLLLANGLGKDQRIAIAEKLQSLAQIIEGLGEPQRAREFFGAASKWFKRAGNEVKAAEMTVYVAEAWVQEAVAQSSQMVAAGFYENAIQTYRTVPRAERARHKVEERLVELHTHLSQAGQRSLDEMGVITSPTYDITEIIQGARDAVKGKNATDALLSLANIHIGAQVARMRKQAEEILRAHPLQTLFSATYYSRDGRVIAKRPGLDPNNEYATNVWAEMIRNFGIEASLAVQGKIWPALEVVALEHRIRERDFISLASRSPIVPRGRARLFGKALFSGYERDFAEALHLLVPQIEHMVRSHLKAAGVRTTVLDSNGIENETGLSALMEIPEVGRVFGDDIAFELKALFCDPLGANLRNELAHGLLDDDQCESFYSIYAWWLGLKLVFNTFWNSLRNTGAQEVGSEEVEEEPA